MINTTFFQLGVPFSDYMICAAIGALPHLYQSLQVGVNLQQTTDPVDGSFAVFYICVTMGELFRICLLQKTLEHYDTKENAPKQSN